MPRTITSAFTAAKNQTKNLRPRNLLEIDTTGGTIYLSDQLLAVSGKAYLPQVKSFSEVINLVSPDESFINESRMKFELINSTLLHAQIQPGDQVRFFLWMAGTLAPDKLPLFTGTITDEIDGDWYTVSFSSDDISTWNNKLIGTLLNVTDFPSADPDHIGLMIPEVYGPVKNHKCLFSQTGGITTLAADIAVGFTGSFDVADVSRFDASATFNFMIGAEEISYTVRDVGNNQLEGIIVRGVGATSPAQHFIGDAVIEIRAMKVKAANHALDALDNTRVVPFGHPVKDAVLIEDLIDTKSLANAELTFDNPGDIAERVAAAIRQQPSALDDTSTGHNHEVVGSSQVTIYGDAVDSQGNVSNPSFAHDQNFDSTYAGIFFTWPQVSGNVGLDFSYAAFDGLTINQAFACVRHSTWAAADTAKLRLPGSTGATLDQDIAKGAGIVTQKFEVAALVNETDWSKLDTLRVHIEDNDVGDIASQVYQIWWEITYEPNVTDTKVNVATTDSTKVQLSGGDFSSFIGGDIIADVQGIEDDGSGTFTGSAGLLIERPGHIIHHLLITHGNDVTAGDIDRAGSFADTESGLPAAYKFGLAITNQIELKTLLDRLAWQCWCRVFNQAGIWKLVQIKDSGTPDKAINAKQDSITVNDRLAVNYSLTPLTSIINSINIKYNLDPVVGGWDNPDAYQASSETSDATSITAFKTRDRVLLAFAIRDNTTMADDIRDKFIARFKVARLLYAFPSFLKHIDLQPGDLITLTVTQLNISLVLCEILAVNYSPPVPNQGISPIVSIQAIDIT